MKEKSIQKLRAVPLLLCAVALTFILLPCAQMDVSAASQAGQKVVPVSDRLIPLGKTTGIKLYADGAMVVGFMSYEIVGAAARCPAREAGIQIGDVITDVNGQPVSTNSELLKVMEAVNDKAVTVGVRRDGRIFELEITAHYDEDKQCYGIGAWVRDSIAGIGTITFVDPENGAFGALGHGICDAETGTLIPFDTGSVMNSSVKSVKKGLSGSPGELSGSFDLTNDQGVLYGNTSSGIFGRLSDETLYEGKKAYAVSLKAEIKEGKAQIISNIEGEKIETFDIEIVRVYQENDDQMRDMMIKITDKKLLEKTGGIVQGMSGSPIIQNGKLVGAVTHVLINDPAKGYAISMERMLEQSRTQ